MVGRSEATVKIRKFQYSAILRGENGGEGGVKEERRNRKVRLRIML